jgi:hypothetical protein
MIALRSHMMSYEVWWSWRTCLHIALKHRQSHNICEESRCSAGSGVGTHSRMLTNSPTDIPLCNSLWYTWRVMVSDTSCFMEKSAILSQWRCNENLELMTNGQRCNKCPSRQVNTRSLRRSSIGLRLDLCALRFSRHPLRKGRQSGNASQPKRWTKHPTSLNRISFL